MLRWLVNGAFLVVILHFYSVCGGNYRLTPLLYKQRNYGGVEVFASLSIDLSLIHLSSHSKDFESDSF